MGWGFDAVRADLARDDHLDVHVDVLVYELLLFLRLPLYPKVRRYFGSYVVLEIDYISHSTETKRWKAATSRL